MLWEQENLSRWRSSEPQPTGEAERWALLREEILSPRLLRNHHVDFFRISVVDFDAEAFVGIPNHEHVIPPVTVGLVVSAGPIERHTAAHSRSASNQRAVFGFERR
jgi:hypothetical protein